MHKNKPPLQCAAAAYLRKGSIKKRGRKEMKVAAHGCRSLSAFKIREEFEQPMTQMKTKKEYFLNKKVS